MTPWSHLAVRVLFAVAAWEVVARATGGRLELLPSPGRVMFELWTWRLSLAEKSAQDLLLVFAGLLIGLCLAVPLALSLDRADDQGRKPHPKSRWLLIFPWPLLALILPALVWRGGGAVRIALAALCAFVWLMRSLRDSLANTPSELWDLARSLGASPWRFEWKVRVPALLPGLFGGLRGGARAALTAVVVAGFVTGDLGLGRLAAEAVFRMNRPLGVAILLAILSLALALEAVIRVLERVTRAAAHVATR